MASTDVPDDLSARPLTDPRLVADVLDLIVLRTDRHEGALVILVCDEDDRLVRPVVVGQLPDEVSDAERDHVLSNVLGAVDRTGSVVVAVARADGLSLRPDDHAWARAAARACAHGPRLLGVHVVTVDGSRQVPSPSAA